MHHYNPLLNTITSLEYKAGFLGQKIKESPILLQRGTGFSDMDADNVTLFVFPMR